MTEDPQDNAAVNWFPETEWELLDWARRAAVRLQERLEAWLVPMCNADRPALELAQLYVAARAMAEAFEAPMKLLDKRIEEIGGQFIPKAYERDKVAKTLNITTPEADFRVTVQVSLRASIRKDQKDAAYEWMRANQLGDLITDTVNAGTLSAAGRKLIEDGGELPEELFATYYQDQTSVTKKK